MTFCNKLKTMHDLYPCPCCGYSVFSEPEGSYEICPICFWEDDGVQLAYPMMPGGANTNSVMECQRDFARTGACESRFVTNVRTPNESDRRASGWRQFDPAIDPHLDDESPEDQARLKSSTSESNFYYWMPDYWLADKNNKEAEQDAPSNSG